MRYQGGKSRASKHITTFINKAIEKSGFNTFLEPFVGGCNIVQSVKAKTKICSDIDYDLIEFWIAVRDGWIPPVELSREQYYYYKNNQHLLTPKEKAFYGYGCSFAGKKWGGYASGEGRNFCKEASVSSYKKSNTIQNVHFVKSSYQFWSDVTGCVIYCDPPYRDTLKYSTGDFNHNDFWLQVLKWKSNSNIVFVSEFSAPNFAKCIWEKERKISTSLDKYKTKTERLYVV